MMKRIKKYTKGEILNGGEGVIGLCIWFPPSNNYENSAIEFYLNSVYQNKLNKGKFIWPSINDKTEIMIRIGALVRGQHLGPRQGALPEKNVPRRLIKIP